MKNNEPECSMFSSLYLTENELPSNQKRRAFYNRKSKTEPRGSTAVGGRFPPCYHELMFGEVSLSIIQ